MSKIKRNTKHLINETGGITGIVDLNPESNLFLLEIPLINTFDKFFNFRIFFDYSKANHGSQIWFRKMDKIKKGIFSNCKMDSASCFPEIREDSMLKYFYCLYHQYEVEKDEDGLSVTSTKELGYFSSKFKAKAKILDYENLLGFKDYPKESFKIIKHGVRFQENIRDKSAVDIYELFHEYEKDGYDYYMIFGIYATEEDAKREEEKQKHKKPYKDFPKNFVIGKWSVDRDFAWEEGFTKWEDE